MATLTPARYVCKLLGVRALARALDLSPGTVSKWQRDGGLIPSQYHIPILAIARKKRKRLSAAILVHGA